MLTMPLSLRAALLLVSTTAVRSAAQQPLRHFSESIEVRYSRSDPIVSYVLRVDSADLTGFDVELRLRNAGDTIRLAMAKHPSTTIASSATSRTCGQKECAERTSRALIAPSGDWWHREARPRWAIGFA